ncbi:MAG TPA: mechanosensitive ion channel [Nanoarchaeota archaeon]|nr:MAG: mscs mechanosensitive ion channel [archaeon GW2011_AR18]HIH25714.1 mechanosensitive ion channel [Nanoarchaeota archaeon]
MVIYSDTVIKIITSFLILILGLVLANVLSNILRKVLKEAEINKILAKQFKIKISVENYLVNIFKYLIYFAAAITVLNQLGIPTFILRIIFLVIVIIVIVFIVLAFKDWIPNLVSGFYIYKTQKIKTGDTIIMNGLTGKVKRINLIETKIITKNNEVIFIPNSNITKYEIVKK